MYFIRTAFQDAADNFCRAGADSKSFLDKVGAVPFSIAPVVPGQMFRIGDPLAFVAGTFSLTEQFSRMCVDFYFRGSSTDHDLFVHVLLWYAIISIVKAYMEVA